MAHNLNKESRQMQNILLLFCWVTSLSNKIQENVRRGSFLPRKYFIALLNLPMRDINIGPVATLLFKGSVIYVILSSQNDFSIFYCNTKNCRESSTTSKCQKDCHHICIVMIYYGYCTDVIEIGSVLLFCLSLLRTREYVIS